VPTVQSAQEEAPSAAEEVPAAQEVQVAAPPIEKVPAEQSSVHSDALAVDELYLPAAQSVHPSDVKPVVVPY
jgi:hypothetical protein